MNRELPDSANIVLDLVTKRMAEIELDIVGCDPEERSKWLSHMAADVQAEHQRNGGADTPESIIRAAAVALMIAAEKAAA